MERQKKKEEAKLKEKALTEEEEFKAQYNEMQNFQGEAVEKVEAAIKQVDLVGSIPSLTRPPIPLYNGGTTNRYCWSQSINDLTLAVPVVTGTTAA